MDNGYVVSMRSYPIPDPYVPTRITPYPPAPPNIHPKAGKDRKPADILLFNCLHGKDECVDVT